MIELNNLKKSFSDEGTVLDVLDVESLTFEDETTYFIRGESGTGKTTLFNVMSGLLEADSGSVKFDGMDVCSMTEKERDKFRATQVGYVFQSFNLFKGFSCLENIIIPLTFGAHRYSAKEAEALAVHALEAVGLAEFRDKRVEKLSGGQQQRIAIARSIINDPAVILADEPTGNLDRKNGEKIIDLLISLAKEREMILIVISHDLSMSSKFDKTLDIEEINKVASVTPA